VTLKTLLAGVVLAVAATAAAAPAGAAIVVSNTIGDVLAPGFNYVATFDAAPAAGYGLSGIYSEFTGSVSGVSAAPPGDATKYVGLQTDESLTLHSVSGFTAFSFYMGSPDDYNHVTVDGQTFSGSALMGIPFISSNGDQSVGRTVTYNLGSVQHDVTFSSSGVAFEFDNLAVAGVPEPASWALMIGGFGMAGAALRRRRATIAA
jgi:hypothetical protein